MSAILGQIAQIFLVVALAPLITGWVRLVKSRLNGRIGASPFQPFQVAVGASQRPSASSTMR